jgi:electron transfer flavoprotein alpha subunit
MDTRTVLIVDDDNRLANYTTEAYVSVIAQLSQANEPAIILLGASVQGRDISGRLAARLRVGVAQPTQIATGRPNVFELNEPDDSRSLQVIDAEFILDDSQLKTRVVESIQNAGGKADLIIFLTPYA